MSEASMTAEEERHIFGGDEPATRQWQPIDTAPKETIVLVYGYWAGELNKTAKVPDVWRASFDCGQWWIDGGEYYAQYVLNPTHWMPLPEPPKAD